MTCREFADFIADYLTGELPPDVRARFDGHLRICPNCVTYLANYRAATRVGKHAFADGAAPLPDDVPEELVQAVLTARRR